MRTTCSLVFVYVLSTLARGDGQVLGQDMLQSGTARNFTGQVVLVTNSSYGLGRVVNALFARLGAHVVVVGKNKNQVRLVAKEIVELSPMKLKPLEMVADLTKSKDAKRLIIETVSKFGKLDVLVNYMGRGDWAGIKHYNFMQVFDQVMKTHLRSSMYVTQQAVPHLLKANGTIINISSILSLNPRTFTLAYSAAKAGIDIMTKVLAQELGPRVRVNAVNIGIMKTKYEPDELISFVKARASIDTPLQRLGEPLEVAKAVVFLASRDASFVTGANLRVDGGYMFNML